MATSAARPMAIPAPAAAPLGSNRSNPAIALAYVAALLVGLGAMLLAMPIDAILGGGPGWNPPQPDQAQALTGHLAFQADRWRWPLLDVQRLFVPHGISLALVDSNALVSILAKLWTRTLGLQPQNWLGAFLAACTLLQPLSAAYAVRGLRAGPAGMLAAAVIAAAWPAFLFRTAHINLCGHFLILLALGLAFRTIEAPRTRAIDRAMPPLLLLASILTHPYLFQLCAAVLAAPPLQAALRRRPGWTWDLAYYALSGALAVGVLILIAGPLGGGDKGFTFFSMNLVSPIWPQLSGVFGPALPIIDSTGGQYEGFNWLGAGTILLLIATLASAAVRRTWPRPPLALALILVALTLLSLSSQVWAGPYKIIDLGTKPWEDIFGSFRSAGRAFWPVGYALMLGAVAAIDRLRRPISLPLLAAAALLQCVDIGPVLSRARAGWVNGAGIVVPPIPAGTTLFTVAPHPGCTPDVAAKWAGPVMLLNAVRIGADTGDIGLGRSPNWFSCEAITADALQLPLLPHEVRAFVGGQIQAPLRPILLGPGAVCRRIPSPPLATTPGAPPFATPPIILCGNEVGAFEGEPVPAGPHPAPVALPLEAGPDKLHDLLGFGWRMGLSGGAWSEGPRSTVLIPVPAGKRLELRLRASGVSFRAGEPRIVSVAVGRINVGDFSLPDGLPTEVVVAVPASTIADGFLRVSLTVHRPVDPARRNLAAPVQRAAILLSGINLKVE